MAHCYDLIKKEDLWRHSQFSDIFLRSSMGRLLAKVKIFIKSFDPQHVALEGAPFSKDLENISGKKVSQDRLRGAIVFYNENHRAIYDLDSLRRDVPRTVETADLYQLSKASNVSEMRKHKALLVHCNEEENQKLERRLMDSTGGVVWGGGMIQPGKGENSCEGS